MNKKVLIIGGTGLVGSAIGNKLKLDYQIIITSKHHNVPGGYQLDVEDTDRLKQILKTENPDIIISAVRGDFNAQLSFHEVLADWVCKTVSKRLIYISTANVFDGDTSRARTEEDALTPETDYGIFKRDCELLLQKKIPKQLIIFRLPAVWAPDCKRIRELKEYSDSGEFMTTYQGYNVNITLADQVGEYAKYVLAHDLLGVFHVGSLDTIDYYKLQKMVCTVLGMKLPNFNIETIPQPEFQAVIPGRKEIPRELQMTILEVMELLKK